MNNMRRKTLSRVLDVLSEVEEILSDVMENEQESYENLPDAFRYGERGEEMEGYIELLDEAIGYVQDCASVIEQI